MAFPVNQPPACGVTAPSPRRSARTAASGWAASSVGLSGGLSAKLATWRPIPDISTPVQKGRRIGGEECSVRDTDAARFYGLLGELDHRLGGPRRLCCCTASSGWPLNGVYFFFEEGENRAADQDPRVVRVGTQAVKTTTPSRRTLWDRLENHRGRQYGDTGGPRRSHSVFRRHLGTAIIRRDGLGDEVCDNWYHYRHQPLEEQIELAVGRYIGVMPFPWLDVPDREARHDIEAGAICLLSRCSGGVDPPSADWLGRYALKAEIGDSGLWNVHHTCGRYDPGFLDLMAARVHALK
jgi:hypothetical protein